MLIAMGDHLCFCIMLRPTILHCNNWDGSVMCLVTRDQVTNNVINCAMIQLNIHIQRQIMTIFIHLMTRVFDWLQVNQEKYNTYYSVLNHSIHSILYKKSYIYLSYTCMRNYTNKFSSTPGILNAQHTVHIVIFMMKGAGHHYSFFCYSYGILWYIW